jgi:predicted phosphodiesterase
MSRLVAVLSDVHGNDSALQACLADATAEAERMKLPLFYWFLGDLVNGLPGTAACFEMLDRLGDALETILLGNHDLAQLLWWTDDAGRLRRYAERDAVRDEVLWRGYIKEESWIRLLEDDSFRLEAVRTEHAALWRRWVDAPCWSIAHRQASVAAAHGLVANVDPFHPASAMRGLLDDPPEVGLNRACDILQAGEPPGIRLLLTGHTHLPAVWLRREGRWETRSVGPGAHADFVYHSEPAPLPEAELCVVNVGSVGMQRDGVWPDRSAYLLLLVEGEGLRIAFRRPPYPLNRAITQYRGDGCPDHVLWRLEQGR